MPYLNLDDRHADEHWGLDNGPWRLNISAQLMISRLESDGQLETLHVPRLMPGFKQSFVEQLVTSGTWEMRAGGIYVPEFLASGNWTKERREAQRASNAARQQKLRETRAAKDNELAEARRRRGIGT